MRSDGVAAETFGKVMSDALREAAGVDEDESGTMLADEFGNTIVNFIPQFMRGNGAEFAGGDFDGEIDFALMTDLDDFRSAASGTGEEMGDELNGLLRGGKTDAERRLAGEGFEAFERKDQVRTALVVGDGVDFVDNDGVNGLEHFAASLGSEENVKRFGRGDEDVGRMLKHGAALVHEGVAGTDGGTDFRHEEAAFESQALNFAKGDFEVGFDVVAKGFQRRDVEDFGTIAEFTSESLANEGIDAGEKGSERFAGTSRRRDERGGAAEDVWPALFLRLGGSAEASEKPFANDGVGPVE